MVLRVHSPTPLASAAMRCDWRMTRRRASEARSHWNGNLEFLMLTFMSAVRPLAPPILPSGQLPTSSRPRRQASCPRELGKCDVVRVDPTKQELGNCDVARVDPTEQELGKCDVVRVDPIERELGKCDVVRVDPTEQELRKCDVVRVDPTERELGKCDVGLLPRVNPGVNPGIWPRE
ncbi:hypothetical protein B296_00047855 [Ensete ventricosum]|uniref:Uncharacterized protein n=1 Tax=Ensete ventricosum TaxID=4639 RepID=A0A426X856_ENSVE|nr:hypothetical protein B296_00047855 [Ensete ventricosum]